MAEPGWFEVRVVLRAPRELVDKAIAAIQGSDLVEVNRVDVLPLDDDLRHWDGSRPPGVVVGMPEPCEPTMDLLEHPKPNPVFDRLRRGIHLHEQ